MSRTHLNAVRIRTEERGYIDLVQCRTGEITHYTAKTTPQSKNHTIT